MTVPGPPASVLSAILRANPAFPYDPADPRQRRMAWFSPYGQPTLPSLITDGVALPQNATLDANITITGYAASQGWGTQGVTSVTAAYTPSPSDAVILCDAAGGAFTITLPDATQPGFISPGQRYTVKKTDTSANTVTLAASAGQLIDGAPTQAITPAQSAIAVVFSGTGWEVTGGGSAIGTNAVGGVVVSGTPATGDVLTATGSGAADWQPSATGVLTTLGDMLYEDSTPALARLAGNTSTARRFLTQTGTGTVSAAPAWNAITAADIPAGSAGQTLTTTSTGAVSWQNAPVDWVNAVTAYGADPTGVNDSTTAFTSAAAATSGVVYAPAGTYLVSGFTLTGTVLIGDGPNTILKPTAGIASPMVTLAGTGAGVRDVAFYGGSTTRSANPAADVISVAAGANRWAVENVTATYCNGWVLNPASITAAAHGTVLALKGTNNAGGINLITATGQTTQVNITDVSLQQCEVNPSLVLENVYDVLVSQFNSSVLGTAAVPTVHIIGNVDACHIFQPDCGVQGTATAGVPVLLIENSGTSYPHIITITGGTFQQGGIGVQITSGSNRVKLIGVTTQLNLTDGFQLTGTGAGISLSECTGSGNNASAGTGYDVNVTSTAHVMVSNFVSYSTAVTDAIIVPATNHVSVVNPTYPGGKTLSGTPAGW